MQPVKTAETFWLKHEFQVLFSSLEENLQTALLANSRVNLGGWSKSVSFNTLKI